MRVLIADKLNPQVTDALEDRGCAVTMDPSLGGDSLTAALSSLNPDVLVVRSTKVQQAQLQAGRNLSLVIRAGAGINTIDLDAASAGGVYVANCPGKNAVAVAELALGHLINLDRRIADNVTDLRAGTWAKKKYSAARGLKGRTLAILGFGNIGREVARRALAFGMVVRAWDRNLTPDLASALGVIPCATAIETCRGADALTIHLGLNDQTRGLVGAQLLEALKPGAYVVNTSRGPLIDQDALTQAIQTRGLRAGLDVFANEPGSGDDRFTDPIAQNPAVYGTHHIGASTDQASEAVGDEVVRIVSAYLQEGEVHNCVNIADRTAATHMMVVRHRDQVGVLARVLDLLSLAAINVQEMENIVFSGGAAASARIQLAGPPSPQVLQDLQDLPAVIAVTVVSLDA